MCDLIPLSPPISPQIHPSYSYTYLSQPPPTKPNHPLFLQIHLFTLQNGLFPSPRIPSSSTLPPLAPLIPTSSSPLPKLPLQLPLPLLSNIAKARLRARLRPSFSLPYPSPSASSGSSNRTTDAIRQVR